MIFTIYCTFIYKLQYVECVKYDGVIVGQKTKKIQRNNTGGPSREISTESKPASLDDDYCFLKINPVVIQYPVLFWLKLELRGRHTQDINSKQPLFISSLRRNYNTN